MLPAAMILLLVLPGVDALPSNMVTLHKIGDCQCGQATIDKKWEGLAVKVVGLSRGRCSDKGYRVSAGNQELSFPLIGSVHINLFNQDVRATKRSERDPSCPEIQQSATPVAAQPRVDQPHGRPGRRYSARGFLGGFCWCFALLWALRRTTQKSRTRLRIPALHASASAASILQA